MTVVRAGPNVADWSCVCTCALALFVGNVKAISLVAFVVKSKVTFAATAGNVAVPVGVAVN